MVILGIDPGYAIVGYGVIRAQNGRFVPLEHGAIVTKAGENFNRRLEIIYDAMTVSYTHVDVYKRQAYGGDPAEGPAGGFQPGDDGTRRDRLRAGRRAEMPGLPAERPV